MHPTRQSRRRAPAAAGHRGILLSPLFADPTLRAALARAERDNGGPIPVPADIQPNRPKRDGAAAVAPRELCDAAC